MKLKKKSIWCIAAVFTLILLFVGWVILSFTLLSDEWLKEKLIAVANESLDIRLDIEEAEFRRLSGEATLKGVFVQGSRGAAEFSGEIESVEVDIAVFPLLSQTLDIKQLIIYNPELKVQYTRQPEPDVEPTLTRLGSAIADSVGGFLDALLTIFLPQEDSAITLDQVIVQSGEIESTILQEGAEPLVLEIHDLEYVQTELIPQHPMDFLERANLTASIDIEGMTASIEKVYDGPNNRRFSMTSLDLGRIDRVLKQRDALIIKAGVLDLEYSETPDDQATIDALIQGLQLAKNSDSPVDDIAFIPVDSLLEYVNAREGSLSLQWKVNTIELKGEASEDVQFLVNEIANGLGQELLALSMDKIEEGVVDKVKAKATQKLRDLLGVDK